MNSKTSKDENNNTSIDLTRHKSHELDIPLISLKIGFEAYYSTYQSVRRFLSVVETNLNSEEFDLWEDEIVVDNEGSFFNRIHVSNVSKAEMSFARSYIETILHFHHFSELTIKELLRKRHELLPCKISMKPDALDKILSGEKLYPNDKEKYSLEFENSRKLMKKLITRGEIDDFTKHKSYFEDEGPLQKLNVLRNKLIHRGSSLVHYNELDIFMGKYILPFTKILLDQTIYQEAGFAWKHAKPHCGVDSMQKIIEECVKEAPNYAKIALLKEIGRASYKNPIKPKRKMRRDGIREVMEERAIKEENNNNEIIDIKNCPICGTDSLIRYRNINSEDEEVGMLKCICCTFEVDSELNNVTIEGLDLRKLWE